MITALLQMESLALRISDLEETQTLSELLLLLLPPPPLLLLLLLLRLPIHLSFSFKCSEKRNV